MIQYATQDVYQPAGCQSTGRTLADIIISRIKNQGPVSFRDFMEMALYYPGYGYYTSPGVKIGREGDYYTSAYLSPLFSHIIAMQLEEAWTIMGKNKFSIVEYGAGTGAMCHTILSYLQMNNPEFYNKLDYFIIERSEVMRHKEQELLNGKVQWINSIKDIFPVCGCILSNELLDNFPVHKVVMLDELVEIFVDYTPDHGFIELSRPASPAMKNYFSNLNISLPKGYFSEINLDAGKWLREISRNLERGFVFTIDYGFSLYELLGNSRKKGSVHCYYNHQRGTDPYSNIGKQDITSFVNFPALDYFGSRYGLKCCGFSTKQAFLHSLGFASYLQRAEKEKLFATLSLTDEKALIHTLLLTMGKNFKVLVQQKGLENPELSGMKFSSNKAW